MKSILSLVLVSFSIQLSAGQFRNLDFEAADLSGASLEFREFPDGTVPPGPGRYPFGTGTAESFLPAWQVFFGNSLTNAVAIGHGFLDTPSVFDGPNRAALLIPGDYFFGADTPFLQGQPD